jgi:serine protease Do
MFIRPWGEVAICDRTEKNFPRALLSFYLTRKNIHLPASKNLRRKQDMSGFPLGKSFVPFVVLPLFLLACSPANQAQPNRPVAAAASPAAAPAGVMLPDFTSLVAKEGPAVVNISVTQTIRRGSPRDPFRGIPPDDPFFEFFHRFFPPDVIPRDRQTQSVGSGFIISDDGYIMTNAHMVDDADEVIVKLTDRREFKARVIGKDRRSDVALIKIDAKGLPKVRIGDPGRLKVGEWVVAIGSPFGFENSVTAGIVSAKGRSLPDENYVPFIQTDVAVNPGNSGGPLFNLSGEVVGINSQIYTRTGGYMGVSFAIPIDVAMSVADQLRTQGKVTRGRLGVGVQDLTQDLALSFGLPSPAGALVSAVEKGSPAEKGGIVAGDVILMFDGKPVRSSGELPPLVAAAKPGTSVKIQVWRKGKTRDLTVTVGELAAERVAERAGVGEAEKSRLGLTLSDLTAEQMKELEIDHGVRVEAAEGAAARAGIRRGDVILAVNDVDVKSAEQFKKQVDRFAEGQIAALLVLRGDTTLYVPVRVGKK